MALRPQTQTYIPTGSTAPTTEVGAYTLCYQHAPVPLTEAQIAGAIEVGHIIVLYAGLQAAYYV